MKKSSLVLLLALSTSTFAFPGKKFLSIDRNVFERIKHELPSEALSSNKSIAVLELDQAEVEHVSAMVHKRLNRCGGFTIHEELKEAEDTLVKSKVININPTIEYVINQQEITPAMVADIKEENIRDMIIKLSSFETRHYTSKTGIASSEYIKQHWSELTKHRSDIRVELFKHKYFPQNSVVLTIQGSEKPEEIIILGGHADSISDEHLAPGADDNASGIASVTEVIRVLMSHNFKPKRTIQFMAYAAEEVGLFGSQDIARTYKKSAAQVIGVMQLDMTLYKGTADKDIILISDYTNKAQNEFLGKLIDEYVKVPWGWSQCGYGCSDHASWTASGYPASFPFESTFDESSPLIHTVNDHIDNYGGDASHSVRFAQLGAAFVIEMAN